MAQSLSAAAGSEIEHVTRLCRRLEFFVSHPPLKVRALSHGESNQSYYVATQQGEYVLRCYPEYSAVCLQQELRCQHAAAAKGLAPAPLCLNNHYQVLLSEYISDGCAFDLPQQGEQQLLHTLAAFHQLKVQTPPLDCEQYVKQLVTTLPAGVSPDAVLLDALQRAAATLQHAEADMVLCHLDLHAQNLLFANNKLWLLDFEYSQLADSSLDLAGLSLHFQLTPAQEQAFISKYAQLRRKKELAGMLSNKLMLAKQVYCGFCWLWYLAIPAYQQQAQHWQSRLQRLVDGGL
ncbi:MAG TPA: phosphotransferase [Rheinheimera sp.]|nr:phosphotransferase [Rheinheimera sp.]